MVEREQWITQKAAAEARGMSIQAINSLASRGRIRSKVVYGKRLVHRGDVLAYVPKTKNRFSAPKAAKKAKGKARK
jgi:hypothetical protein